MKLGDVAFWRFLTHMRPFPSAFRGPYKSLVEHIEIMAIQESAIRLRTRLRKGSCCNIDRGLTR